MSRVVAAITSPPPSPTLGELMKRAGDDDVDDTDLEMSRRPTSTIPFVLSFSHLTYTVRSNRTAKTILDDVSGEARDGEITAVMGASGSGKSTLLDALAGRISRGSLGGGHVTLNGEPLDSKLTSTISAYVMQDDLLHPMLTVEETLLFAAEFRLPRALSRPKKRARVEALLDQLGLRAAARTLVGDEGRRGVSGGERRRVSIGIDVVHDPILLFLDEPTSGLDSTSAHMLVKVLQRIARSGSIVVLTLHQPSYRILGLLDQTTFLSRGRIVYSGSPSNLPLFLDGFGRPIPDGENRAEFALDLVRELEVSPGGTKGLVEFNKAWQKKHPRQSSISNGFLSLKEAITASVSRGKLVSGATGGGMKTFANPLWIEVAVLSKRSLVNSTRMPHLFLVRLGAVMVTGFILASVFWRLDDSPRGIQERFGFFAFAMSTTFYAQADALPVFIQERYIFLRETAHNAYRKSSYVLSHALTSLPGLLFLSFMFAAATFWAVGLSGSFFFYLVMSFASFWVGSSFVTLVSALVPQVMLGYVIVVSLLAYFLLFSGFFIHRDRIPAYWIWFHYVSVIKYPYEGVLLNEFHDANKCFVRGKQMFDGTPLAEVADGMKEKLLESMSGVLGVPITRETCVTTGGDVLRQQGISGLTKWDCVWVTVAWGFLFRILFYFILLWGTKNKRK